MESPESAWKTINNDARAGASEAWGHYNGQSLLELTAVRRLTSLPSRTSPEAAAVPGLDSTSQVIVLVRRPPGRKAVEDRTLREACRRWLWAGGGTAGRDGSVDGS
jgi:hypothetical protein